MLVFLSPAKTLDFSLVDGVTGCTKPAFLSGAVELAKVLKKFNSKDLQKLMSVSGKIADLNVDRYKQFSASHVKSNSKPALFAYQGDVYREIPVVEYKKSQLDYAQKHLRIISGLYGLLRPLDLIQGYRLEMKTKLKNSSGNDLYDFWLEELTKSVRKDAKKQKSKFLVNLASNEYSTAINFDEIDIPTVSPVFKDKKNGSYKVLGLFAKRARGMMADFIVQNRPKSIADLNKFSSAGYGYNSKLSTELEPVFTR